MLRAKNWLIALPVVALLAAGLAWADGTVGGKVVDVNGKPIEGVIIRVPGTTNEATTFADGTYVLDVPAGAYRVVAIAVGYSPSGASITVSNDLKTELNFELRAALSQFGEQIVVLGSRSERTALETAVPVDVLTEEDLQDSGQTETARMIQFLAPSFNVSTSTISDGTDIVRPSTLRSLGPDQTLVLVNGKRRHNSALVHVNGSIGRGTAGTDLNAIPASSISTIEILRDGAAAQYGSDAIAGVMNVRLANDVGVTHVDLSYGQAYEGDGETSTFSINRGWAIGDDGGFINATFEYRDRGATNRAGLDPRRIYNYQEQVFGQPALVDSNGDGICDSGGSCTLDPNESTYDRLNHRYGDADSENMYLFVNSEIPLSDGSKIYFFGGASQRDGESAGFNRLPGQSRTLVEVYPDGFLPLIDTDVDDMSLSVGLESKLAENWTLDTGFTYGGNEFQFNIANSANTSLGPLSPLSADAGTLSFNQFSANVDVYGATTWGSTPVGVAFGFEYRQDMYEIEEGDAASWIDGGVPDQFGGRSPAGIQVFPGFRPTNAVDTDRDNFAAYGDIEFNLSDSFMLGLAARFEEYSDFGSNLSGKIAARWELTDDFALRGSLSTGFRAPSLHQSHFNNISTQFVDVSGVLTPLEVGTFQVSDPVAVALGATPLEEETSFSYSGGFTWRPKRNLSVTADYFSIDIEDRIVLTGRFSASNPQIAPILAPFGVNAAQFFTNAIDTTTDGVDLVVAWSKNLGSGSLSLTGAANWNETRLDGEVRTPPQLAGLGETLFDDIEVTYLERGQPRELYNFGARYSKDKWAALVRVNKFGAVQSTESASDPSRKQTFTGKWLTDVEFSWRFTDGLRLAVGGNNVFDEFPDENIPSNSFNGIFVYPRRTAPFGFNGGYWYGRLSFDF